MMKNMIKRIKHKNVYLTLEILTLILAYHYFATPRSF